MANTGKKEIVAQLDALRRLARDVLQKSKDQTMVHIRDRRALRQQQMKAIQAIDAEIDGLKQLRRRVLRSRSAGEMAEKFTF
ncbi:hypothetical protein JQ596_15920 [Bradyrhizobium manausense]|uniref:hypothetical protein n=1 Tax=Bradyrhizobium TaxID=374 RepID=UPI001BA8FA6A|nr:MULTISPECIES: hypothetical protein [Bradyrhizobium]MBR0827030.1 hypothetical protein [Bradyrhizobium manausense]UVO32389.1 hypothetical protein KUF59_18060 [Bradyrhizobium arachidis]